MTHDRCLEWGRKKQGKDNDCCDFLINIFFLIFYINIPTMFQRRMDISTKKSD